MIRFGIRVKSVCKSRLGVPRLSSACWTAPVTALPLMKAWTCNYFCCHMSHAPCADPQKGGASCHKLSPVHTSGKKHHCCDASWTLTSAGKAAGLACAYRAETPDTMGQAMDVPVAVMLAVVV